MPRPGVLEVRDFPDPVLARKGDVVVQMHYASVCGSDLHMLYDGLHRADQIGRAGYPGHEGVGVVQDSRSARFLVGTPVLTVPPGDTGGCFAELQLIDDGHLLPLSAGADLSRLLMAQQLGTTVFAAKRYCQPSDRTAAVIGAGSAGLFFLQLLLLRGYERVLVSEPHPARLAVAEELGALAVHVPERSLVEAVLDATAGQGVDLVVETAGTDACRAQAVDAVRRYGTVGLFGYPERPGLAPFPVQAAFRKAVSAVWTSGAQAEPGLTSFAEAVQLIDDGTVDVDFCLRRTVGLDNAVVGVELARQQGEIIKVVVDLRRTDPR